jgi:hypothetical protein
MGHTSFNLSQAYNHNLKDINWYYKQWQKLEELICVDCIVYGFEEMRKNQEFKLGQNILDLKDIKELKESLNYLIDEL